MSTDTWLAISILAMIPGFPGAILLVVALEDRKSAKKVKEAEARSYRVAGTVARFAPSATDEYSVDYSFKLVDDNEVYHITSNMLPPGGHGELTAPGDRVEFRVFPGLKYVRDFRNAATAQA